jgi:hypothetical protein
MESIRTCGFDENGGFSDSVRSGEIFKMGVIDTVKEVGFLIQKLDNIDLVKRMMELQEQVYALVDENRDLKDENRHIKERLTTREAMTFRDNSYWRAGGEGPFCARCFDAEGLSMRLQIAKGYVPRCPKCGTSAPDPNREPPKPVARVSHSSFLNKRRGGY